MAALVPIGRHRTAQVQNRAPKARGALYTLQDLLISHKDAIQSYITDTQETLDFKMGSNIEINLKNLHNSDMDVVFTRLAKLAHWYVRDVPQSSYNHIYAVFKYSYDKAAHAKGYSICECNIGRQVSYELIKMDGTNTVFAYNTCVNHESHCKYYPYEPYVDAIDTYGLRHIQIYEYDKQLIAQGKPPYYRVSEDMERKFAKMYPIGHPRKHR